MILNGTILWSRKTSSLSRTSSTSYQGLFERETNSEEISTFWPKSSVNPLENENILTILYSDIFVVLKLDFFSIEHHQHHIKAFLKEKQIWKKFQPFDQNHGLTGPLEKCKYFSYLIVTFLQSRKTSLLSRTSSNIIYLRLFSKEVLIWPKSWVNMFGSLRKCQHFVMWPPISPQNDVWELSEDLSLPRSG